MVVSTFSTFSTVNLHRAVKAVNDYVASKYVKIMLRNITSVKIM